MKKRLTRKLFLSIAALGVTAATLTTSTFAWYTANTEAKVNTITASTEAAGADSLFIATANEYANGATTGQKATGWDDYLATATPHLTGTTTFLKPVYSNYGTAPIKAAVAEDTEHNIQAQAAVNGRSYNQFGEATPKYDYAKTGDAEVVSGKTYYTYANSVYTAVVNPTSEHIADYYEQTRAADTVTYANEDTASFLEFVFRVRTSKPITEAKPLYFSQFNLTSAATTGSLTQVALASGQGTGITSKGLYGAQLVKALKLDITSANVDLANDGTIPDDGKTARLAGETAETNAVTTLGFENLANVADTNITANGANAVGYYNKVMGTNLVTPSTDYATEVAAKNTGDNLTDIVVATLPKTADGKQFSVVEVRFVLYLDGWDNYCYDIMQNQTVNLEFKLTTDSSLSCLKK